MQPESTNPSRVASFDLGTNTFLLLIAEVRDNHLDPVCERETMVRLGKGVDAAGNLDEQAMARGIACLNEYVSLAAGHNCEKIIATGTSALRDAANRENFLQRARREAGVDIEIISGETEAHLTYLGALSNKRDLPEPVAILDVGGGSTEVVTGTHETMLAAASANIGSVRLTERWLHNDPVTSEEVELLREQARSVMLQTWPETRLAAVKSLVGTAGTITTLAAMAQRLSEYDPSRIDRYVLPMPRLTELVGDLSRLSVEERKRLAGLRPSRADVILAGALILETFMNLYGFTELIVSHRGLRHGVLVDRLFEKSG